MTESESVALPLGDTPISSYQYILADIADYIKHFLYLFQKIFNAGGARRRGGGGEDKATAPESGAAASEGGAAVRRRGGSARRLRGGTENRATPEGGRRHRRQGDGSKTGRRVAFRLRVGEAVVQEDGAAIAFYIFFKNFSIPRKRRGEHPAF